MKQLCLGVGLMLPGYAAFQEVIHDGGEPPGDRNEDQLMQLTLFLEAPGDRLQGQVRACGDGCGLQEHISQCSPPARIMRLPRIAVLSLGTGPRPVIESDRLASMQPSSRISESSMDAQTGPIPGKEPISLS
jgi:hypothetical protein